VSVPGSSRAGDRYPGSGTVSLATTIGIDVAIIGIQPSLSGAGFGAIGVFLLMVLLAGVGVVVNTIAGLIAHQRGEAWGARIAALGIVALIATVLVVRGR
jgi:hypothetical protein